jgi:hypothetical protein
MATLRGEPVDRPAVNLYEIGGFIVNPYDPDPFNVYNDPSWRPLLELAEEKTDLIRMVGPTYVPIQDNPRDQFIKKETREEGDARHTVTTITAGGRTLTSRARRDAGVNTLWTTEHLLKGPEDLHAYLELPDEVFHVDADISRLLEVEEQVGDRGIVMVDTGDPLAVAADLFSMQDFLMLAFTEPDLFHQLMEKIARYLYRIVEQVSTEFPGRLWRIYGPEYAAEPYLPPKYFRQFVVQYDEPMVRKIQEHGGFARIHSHGKLRNILPAIASMNPAGLDPIEPPPQGDVELIDVRREYGREMVLFGNLEATDIENMEPAEFEMVVAKALEEGTHGEGRGFVLTPSAAPYGRTITQRTMQNYETIVRLATGG